MQKLRCLIVAGALLGLSLNTLAGVIPQTGLWFIVPEATGNPGRGLTIDVQGDTLILTVYGYTQEGRATFYQASGPYTDGQFSADLGMYGGGTALGGERVPAQYIGSASTVSLSFSSEAEGMVTLPGEEAKPIARLVTADAVKPYRMITDRARFNAPGGQFFQIGKDEAGGHIIESYAFTNSNLSLQDGQFNFRYDILKNQNWVKCELAGGYHQSGSEIVSQGNYTCSDSTLGTYRVKNLQRLVKNGHPDWDDQVLYSGQFYFKLQGSKDEEFYVLRGTEKQSNYVGPSLVPPTPEYNRILNPQNGLWWTATESQGIPGRGFNLDRQGDTLVLTFFGYDEEGRSTFYIASGPFSSYEGFSAELLMVEGGTALGGTYIPAKITGSKGTVSLKFTSDVDGVITLPGEKEQVIKRFTVNDISMRFMQKGGEFLGFYNQGLYSSIKTHSVRYEFSMDEGQFALKLIAQSEKTSTKCVYSGTYEPVGIVLYSRGSYECVSKVLETEYWGGEQEKYSKGTYVITDLVIDEWGIFNGNIQYPDWVDWFNEDQNGSVGWERESEQLHIGGRYVE